MARTGACVCVCVHVHAWASERACGRAHGFTFGLSVAVISVQGGFRGGT